MRISISLPDPMLEEVDATARKLRVSRSKLVQMALQQFLQHRREKKMTGSINRYVAKYGNELSAEDEAWLAHGRGNSPPHSRRIGGPATPKTEAEECASASMKTAISLPNELFEEAEAAAKELGLSRSKLMQAALEEFLARRKADEVTRRLNKSYAEHPAEHDPFLEQLVLEAMKRTEWEE